MITIKKLLVIVIASVMISLSLGATAFASELAATETQTIQNGTEDTNNSDIFIVGQSTEVAPVDELLPEVVDEEEILDQQELLLLDGYFLDEQGQLYYEEPKEELVIEEVVEEEIEETKEKIEEEKVIVVKKPSYSEKDLRLLSCLIYSEAGNQSYNGMLAVANVVLNRMKSDIYWHVDTVEEVIFDRKWSVQFAVTIKGSKSGLSMMDKALKYYDTRKSTGGNPTAQEKALNKAIKAAKAALEGTNNIGDYLCFQNKRSASSIKRKYSDYKIIGDHLFYRTK